MTVKEINRISRKEPQACQLLYEKHKVKFYALCLRYTNSKDTASDMMQEGFMEIFSVVKNYKGKGSFEGFIKKVFLYKVLQFVRKNYQQIYGTYELDIEADIEISAEAISNLSYEELLSEIRKLPEGYRAVFNLRAIDGYTHSEIAALLNISESTSRSQYSRAKQILKKEILKFENTLQDERL